MPHFFHNKSKNKIPDMNNLSSIEVLCNDIYVNIFKLLRFSDLGKISQASKSLNHNYLQYIKTEYPALNDLLDNLKDLLDRSNNVNCKYRKKKTMFLPGVLTVDALLASLGVTGVVVGGIVYAVTMTTYQFYLLPKPLAYVGKGIGNCLFGAGSHLLLPTYRRMNKELRVRQESEEREIESEIYKLKRDTVKLRK